MAWWPVTERIPDSENYIKSPVRYIKAPWNLWQLRSSTGKYWQHVSLTWRGSTRLIVLAMEGYPKLASWMSRYPEMAIFRSFRTLHMQTLLYQQAGLVDLEAALQRSALANKNGGDPRKAAYERNMWELNQSADDGCGSQLQITKRIQEKLESYGLFYYPEIDYLNSDKFVDFFLDRAMLRQSALLSLDVPSDRNLKFFRDWLDHPRKGKSFLEDLEKNTWDEVNEFELVSLRQKRQENDILSQWTEGKLLLWFHRLIGHKIKVWISKDTYFSIIAITCNSAEKLLILCLDYQDPVSLDPESGTANYDDKAIQRVINVISIVMACLVLFLPIVLLYIVSNTWSRLCIVAVSIVISAASLSVTTTASRLQILATTSA